MHICVHAYMSVGMDILQVNDFKLAKVPFVYKCLWIWFVDVQKQKQILITWWCRLMS